MGQTIAEAIFEEGELKGLERGRLQHARTMLIRFVRKRLGEPDEATRAAIEGTTDLDRLERMLDRHDTAADWADLLATP